MLSEIKRADVYSTGQYNTMCITHFRGYQDATSFKNKRPNDTAGGREEELRDRWKKGSRSVRLAEL